MTATTSPPADAAGAAADRANPFPGLRPFREDEESLFFGRESQVDAMVDKLAATRFLSVVGTSGSGKSSLVNCGLRPALHRGLMAHVGTTWRIAQFRPGADPVSAMAVALAQEGVLFRDYRASGLTLAQIVDTTLRMSKVGLVDIVEQARLDGDVNLLVVVDQFEELFRYRQLQDAGQDGAYGVSEDAAAFVNLLLEAKEQSEHPIHVVLTMRSDFLGECAQFPGLAEAVNGGQYLVPRLTREERRAAIAGPIGVRGAAIEPVLLTRLLNDVGDNPDQLSILQHALNRTWARWQGVGGDGPLRLQHYEDIGTMAHALDRHAEKAFGELAGDDEQKLCEKIFKALTDKATDPRGVRRPTKVRALCEMTDAQEADVAAVIAVFRKPSRSFVMPPADETLHPETVVDISHESLMRIWQRLNGWADEEAQSARTYRRLAELAADHEAGEAGLLRDPELQFALNWRDRNQPNESWASRYHAGFAPAMSFLAESEKARDKERRRARMRVAVLVALVIISAAVGLVAVLKGREAVRQRRDAENASKAATLLALTATANDRTVTPLGSALLLSLAAYRRSPGFDSRRSVVLALAAAAEQPVQLILRTHKPASALALSPDGYTVATADRSGDVRLWNLNTRRQVGPTLHVVNPGTHTTTIHPSVAFGKRGMIAEGTDARLTLWVPGKRAESLHDDKKHIIKGNVRTVAFSPDGKLLATSGFDGIVRLWDVGGAKPKLLRRLSFGKHPHPVNSLMFDPQGELLAVGGDTHGIGLWLVGGSSTATQRLREKYGVNSLAWGLGRFGLTLAAAGDDGAIHVLGAVRKKLRAKRVKDTGRSFVDLAMTSNGDRIAGASDDGTVRVWKTSTGNVLLTATTPASSTSRTVDFERDGRLVSVSADGTITVWSKRPSSFGAALPSWFAPPPSTAVHGRRVRVLLAPPVFALPPDESGAYDSFPGMAASPDGTFLVTGDLIDGLHIWNARKRSVLRSHSGAATDSATAVAFSPDGKLLAEASFNDLHLWRAAELPRLVSAGRAHLGGNVLVDAVAFNRDGLLASGDTDGNVYIWNTRIPGSKPRLVGEGSDRTNPRDHRTVLAVAFSPDGKTLASGGWDGKLRLRHVGDLSHPRVLGKAPSAIRGIAFGPNGRLIAVGSSDGTISVWDSVTGKKRTTTPDSAAVESVAFTAGGRVLVTAGDDGVIRFWDVGTRNLRPLGQLAKSHVGRIRRLTVSQDGSVLASAQGDDDVRLWPGIVWPTTSALTDRICRLVAGGIASGEWNAIIPAGVKQPLPHLCGT